MINILVVGENSKYLKTNIPYHPLVSSSMYEGRDMNTLFYMTPLIVEGVNQAVHVHFNPYYDNDLTSCQEAQQKIKDVDVVILMCASMREVELQIMLHPDSPVFVIPKDIAHLVNLNSKILKHKKVIVFDFDAVKNNSDTLLREIKRVLPADKKLDLMKTGPKLLSDQEIAKLDPMMFFSQDSILQLGLPNYIKMEVGFLGSPATRNLNTKYFLKFAKFDLTIVVMLMEACYQKDPALFNGLKKTFSMFLRANCDWSQWIVSPQGQQWEKELPVRKKQQQDKEQLEKEFVVIQEEYLQARDYVCDVAGKLDQSMKMALETFKKSFYDFLCDGNKDALDKYMLAKQLLVTNGFELLVKFYELKTTFMVATESVGSISESQKLNVKFYKNAVDLVRHFKQLAQPATEPKRLYPSLAEYQQPAIPSRSCNNLNNNDTLQSGEVAFKGEYRSALRHVQIPLYSPIEYVCDIHASPQEMQKMMQHASAPFESDEQPMEEVSQAGDDHSTFDISPDSSEVGSVFAGDTESGYVLTGDQESIDKQRLLNSAPAAPTSMLFTVPDSNSNQSTTNSTPDKPKVAEYGA